MELKCAMCGVEACREEPEHRSPPRFCPMSSESPTADETRAAYEEARAAYTDPETRRLAQAAVCTESASYRQDTPEGPVYCRRTRVEEVMDLAKRLDVARLGIAFCGGLVREVRLLQEVLEANGFEVCDLGRDVPIDRFIEEAEKMGADIIGSSALLTTTMDVQKRLEQELKKAGLKGKYRTMVGGAPVTQRWADRIGADAFAEDAADGVRKAKALLGLG